MSNSRRAKKNENKNSFMVIILIICIIIVAITFWMLHDIQNKVDNQVSNNSIINENMVDNITNNEIIEENTVIEENVVGNNTAENTAVTNNTAKNTTINNSAPYKPAETDKKQEAVNLVKKNWGEDSSVSFAFEYINENGEYVVSVKDKSTATVKYYFRVNIEAGSVELD